MTNYRTYKISCVKYKLTSCLVAILGTDLIKKLQNYLILDNLDTIKEQIVKKKRATRI